MPRHAVVLPAEITESSVVFSVTVNGRLLRYGVRSTDERMIYPSLAARLSDEVLACIMADLADCEYIDVHHTVTSSLLARLREVAMENERTDAIARRCAHPTIRASRVVPASPFVDDVFDTLPSLDIICDHVPRRSPNQPLSSATARPSAEELLRRVIDFALTAEA